jgi:hypothetical protein
MTLWERQAHPRRARELGIWAGACLTFADPYPPAYRSADAIFVTVPSVVRSLLSYG